MFLKHIVFIKRLKLQSQCQANVLMPPPFCGNVPQDLCSKTTAPDAQAYLPLVPFPRNECQTVLGWLREGAL